MLKTAGILWRVFMGTILSSHVPSIRLAQKADCGAFRTQANPVAGAKNGGAGHGRVIEERAVAAAIEKQVGAMIEQDFAMPRRDNRKTPGVEQELAADLRAKDDAGVHQEKVLTLKT